ncbi:hypothetical protein [Flavobacterium silvaticum]|uniref:Uncharacterized protein n=1 Tax=Flavobacterium silvaticum TaxID=1852020 RepID=A0A972FVD0_9FLAO|nr:hypothetical protein [Flavobacterium silvaticum]NMH28717.1 hypothetical protein [Flavobacterium silvaticum]
MNYSVNNLTTVADCDVLLSWAAREKSDLDYKKITDERMTTRYVQSSAEIDAELQGVIAEIAATETIILTLPEGPSRDEAMNRKIRLEYKKFVLETRRESYGTIALIEKEVDLARVNQELTEVDAFIVAITNKKASLQA